MSFDTEYKRKRMFDVAVENLTNDVNNPDLTIEQVVHTAECIATAYGAPAMEVVALAIAEARLRRWVPPVNTYIQ
ncbi:MAG: hypothetical protein ACXAB9_10470 [Candidatus Thorarchaeota archaeon]|jgi:hypothetical protein